MKLGTLLLLVSGQIASIIPKELDQRIEDAARGFKSSLTEQELGELNQINFKANDPANSTALYEKAVTFTSRQKNGRALCSALVPFGISDSWWCARALIVAANRLDTEQHELVWDVVAGALVSKLDSKTPSESAPAACSSEKMYRITPWNDSKDKDWFRDRAAFWVKCNDGHTMLFLPERGWFDAPDGYHVK